ncbi:MAG: hypothetical protein RL348_1661 [Bacteroidota bacterium]|jgi:hypothetical protein
MDLIKHLSKSGYDLIDGPIRNHQPLQLWLKQGANRPELYFEHINQVFKNPKELVVDEDPTLNVDATQQVEHDFTTGLTVLKELMQGIGGTPFDISTGIQTGRKISIKYKDAYAASVAIGQLTTYLGESRIEDLSESFIHHLNSNQVLLITGVVFAKQLVMDVSTDRDIDLTWVAKLQAAKDPKLSFSLENKRQLKMTTNGSKVFPIAIKANRLDYDRAKFKRMRLVTDNRNFF